MLADRHDESEERARQAIEVAAAGSGRPIRRGPRRMQPGRRPRHTPVASRRASPSCARLAASRTRSSTTSTRTPRPWSTCSRCYCDDGRLHEAAEVALESVRVDDDARAAPPQGRLVPLRRGPGADHGRPARRGGRGSSTMPASCSRRASTPFASTWWTDSCPGAAVTSSSARASVRAAPRRRAPASRPAPARPALRRPRWRPRSRWATTWPRRRGRRTACADWTRCRTPPTSRRCWPRPPRSTRAP